MLMRRINIIRGLFIKTRLNYFSSLYKEIMILEDKLQHSIKQKYVDQDEFAHNLKDYTIRINMENKPLINEKLIDEIKNFIKSKIHSFENKNFLDVTNSIWNINRGDKLFHKFVKEKFKVNFLELIKNPHSYSPSDDIFMALKQFFRLFTEMREIDQVLFSAFLRFFNRNQHHFYSEEAFSELIWNITLNLCLIFRQYKTITRENAQIINELLNKSNLFLNHNYSTHTSAKIRFYKSIYYLNIEKFKGILLSSFNLNYVQAFKPFYIMNYERVTTESNLQNKFEDILKEIKVNYTQEFKTDFCVVDFMINTNIIFEINGPQHYIGLTSELKAQDIIKGRVLRI